MKNYNEFQKKKDLNDPEFLAKWVYEDSYEDKKNMFTNDVIEYLTSYFGIGKRYNRKSLTKIINDIFDFKMKNIPYDYDSNAKICRQMDVKKIDGEFDDEESRMIETIIDNIWQ